MSDRSLTINFVSGDASKIHYGFMLGAGAAAINREVTLFFTMEGLKALTSENPEIEELVQACLELGATFLVCETGLHAIGLTMADLRQDLPLEVSGVVGMLNAADGHAEIVVL